MMNSLKILRLYCVQGFSVFVYEVARTKAKPIVYENKFFIYAISVASNVGVDQTPADDAKLPPSVTKMQDLALDDDGNHFIRLLDSCYWIHDSIPTF
jgi:hypothetical protein